MGSQVNENAVETYVVEMLSQMGTLLKEAGNPHAERAFALAADIRKDHSEAEDRPSA